MLASDEIRDRVARILVDAFAGIWDALLFVVGSATFTVWAVSTVAVVVLGWRLSVTLGPLKKCWRCTGGGHVGGLLGGRRKCKWCAGSGLRNRIGTGGQ
jgi:hypothetical protein